MAGIGNYIHLTATGYLKKGNSKEKNSVFENYISQKNSIKTKVSELKTGLKPKDKDDLEKLLESLTKIDSNNNSNAAQKRAKLKIQRRMEKLFGESLEEINWSTGDIVSNKKGPKIGIAHSSVNVQDVVNRIERLHNALIKKAETDINANEALIQLEKIKAEYFDVLKKIQGVANDNEISFEKLPTDYSKSLSKFKDSLNELIKEWAAYPSVALQKGTFFETLIAYAPLAARNLAERQIGKVVGDIPENVSIRKENFDEKLTGSFFNNLSKDCSEKTTVSQGKVDVEIKWRGKDLKISAKNVNFNNKYIQLVSGTSLLNLLQDEPVDFVNHALNILSNHIDDNMPFVREKNLSKMRVEMQTEIRLIILYKALTGDIGKRTKANLFIINDNRTGNVKVFEIADIIDKVIQKAEKENFSVRGVSITGGFGYNMQYFKNEKASSSEARISSLLADVHSRKISVALNTSILTK
jgi:hypothetical protein